MGFFQRPTGGNAAMDAQTRLEIETAAQAVDDALTGLVGFLMTLRPTLRNEILQICGHHMERAREAKDRLRSLLDAPSGPGSG
jgi:hypothetical protein